MSKVTINPSLKAKLERAIALKTANLAEKIYNAIIVQDQFPYWSGAYVNSWVANQTGYGLDKPQGTPGQYPIPDVESATPNLAQPYKSWYVSNAYSFAHEIEYEGTPRHASPWMTLHHAVNMVTKLGV
jgi:hypothetical protein